MEVGDTMTRDGWDQLTYILADKLAVLVQNTDASWGPCIAAAKAYQKARGI